MARAPYILRDWTNDVNYDEILLTWHVTNELCYWVDNRYRAMKDKSVLVKLCAVNSVSSCQITCYILY